MRIYTESSSSYDVCIIGSGPAALTCMSSILEPYSVDNLTEAQAEHAAKIHHRHHRKLKVCVVDPNSQWLDRWKTNFEQLKIECLRSPAMAHPNMFDIHALLTCACNKNNLETNHLYRSGCRDMKQLGAQGRETGVGLWDLPSTSIFTDFCDDLVHRLPHTFLQGYATDLKSVGKNNNGPYQLEWIDSSGMKKYLSIRRVIFAMGAIGKPVIPRGLDACPTVWWNSPDAFLSHNSSEPMATNPRKHILVVGGGLTAVQAALRVVDYGHTCVLCSRRQLQEKHFDIPVKWFNPYKKNNCFFEFYHETIANRLNMLKEARDGGSIPPIYMQRIAIEKRKERLTFWVGQVGYNARCNASSSAIDGNKINISFNEKSYWFDKVILATGITPECTANPFIKKVLERFPIPFHGGFPDLTKDDLRWSEGSKIFVTGAMAALQVGPDAGNLMGMRRAATAISNALGCRHWLRKTVLANPYDILMIDSDEGETDCEDDIYCDLCLGLP